MRVDLQRVSASSAQAAALLAEYYAELATRLGAFDPTRDPRPSESFEPPHGAFLLATGEEQPLACGGIKLVDATTAEIKQMYVSPAARGHGLGRRMLQALEEVARELGATRVRLDTAAPLVEAAALYRAAGYRAIAPYNDNPYAAAWFEKTL